MSKADRKKMDRAKAITDAAVAKWKPLMGLGMWEVTTIFHRDDADVPKRFRDRKSSAYAAMMWCEVQWEYLQVTITVALHRIGNHSADAIEAFVRHELAHAVVNEMREFATHPHDRAMKHEERVVSTLELAFVFAYNEGWNDGRRNLRKSTRKKGAVDAA